MVYKISDIKILSIWSFIGVLIENIRLFQVDEKSTVLYLEVVRDIVSGQLSKGVQGTILQEKDWVKDNKIEQITISI